MGTSIRILVINPGSTSTKVSVYEDGKELFTDTVRHTAEDMRGFEKIFDQLAFRKETILTLLRERHVDAAGFDAVVGRGGNMKPVQGGTYRVNEAMIRDLEIGVMGQHASNLGGVLAYEIANGKPAYVVDPVIVDEFEELARFSGIPEISRKSKDHPLNQKAIARRAAAEMGSTYREKNFVVVHMGGGISVGAHKNGRIVDVNNALDGDGPFSPERAGGLPFGSLIDLCYSGKYTKEQLRKRLIGGGGLVAYLGTNNGRKVREMIDSGDEKARLTYEAMAYQIAKEIGAAATVLEGKVDAILLSGGLAYDDMLVNWIRRRTDFIAPVRVYPGEDEMSALCDGVMRVLTGKEAEKIYQ